MEGRRKHISGPEWTREIGVFEKKSRPFLEGYAKKLFETLKES